MSVYLGTNLVSILSGTKNINGDISLQDKEIDPTESIQYVTADSSYDGLNTVQVNAISSTYIGSGIKKKNAATYTPNNTVQTIASGQYLSGTQTIEAVPTETKTIDSNGTYTPTNGKYFNSVTVNVPTGSGSSAVLGTKTITSNGTYNASSDDLDGYSSVTVNVPEKTFTTQEKSVSPTESSQVVAPDAGYDGLSQVTVSAIPTTYVGSGIAKRSSVNLVSSGDTVIVPSGYYSEDSTKSVSTASLATPSISIDAAGLITATENQAESGYVNAEVKTATKQMTVKGATTYTPGDSAQTIAAGTYLIGVQTISAVSTESKTISPSTSEQIISPSTGKYLSSVTVEAIPTVTQATPSISISTSGLVAATSTQSEGYVSAGTKTATSQLSTLGSTAYIPTTSDQTISAGVYLIGNQTIKGDSNLVGENIISGASIFGVAGTVVIQKYYTGSEAPSSSLGNDGDIYLQI